MLFGAFRPPKPENRILLWYPLDGHGYIFHCNHLPQGKIVTGPASVVAVEYRRVAVSFESGQLQAER
jgi:hypothetical protein